MSVLEFVSIGAGRPVRPGRGGRRRAGRRARVVRDRRAGRRRGGCMRVLVAEPVAQEGVELLRAQSRGRRAARACRATSCARSCPTTTRSSSAARSRSTPALIAAGTRLVVIGRAGVGVDNVDLEAATRAGIVVVNAPTGNTIAAAEHTLALLYGARPPDRRRPTPRSGAASGSGPSSPASSCAAGRSASSGSARSARPSRSAPGRWR